MGPQSSRNSEGCPARGPGSVPSPGLACPGALWSLCLWSYDRAVARAPHECPRWPRTTDSETQMEPTYQLEKRQDLPVLKYVCTCDYTVSQKCDKIKKLFQHQEREAKTGHQTPAAPAEEPQRGGARRGRGCAPSPGRGALAALGHRRHGVRTASQDVHASHAGVGEGPAPPKRDERKGLAE